MKSSSCSQAIAAFLLLISMAAIGGAAEPVKLVKVVDPGPNDPDEPLAAEFSIDRATHFLDSAAITWQKDQQCFTCHTNFVYLYARPPTSTNAIASPHRDCRISSLAITILLLGCGVHASMSRRVLLHRRMLCIAKPQPTERPAA